MRNRETLTASPIFRRLGRRGTLALAISIASSCVPIVIPIASTRSTGTVQQSPDQTEQAPQAEVSTAADGTILIDARRDPRPKAKLTLLNIPAASLYEPGTHVGDQLHAPTAAEAELVNALNDYRARHGLRRLPWSRSLSHVAAEHARDLGENPPNRQCMIHSWSNSPLWKGCCYRPDHADAKCMWNKPRELTSYPGIGFELAYMHSAGVRAQFAVDAWRDSPNHRSVLLNRGKWVDNPWRAMGVGIRGNYAVIWFGEKYDPAGYWASEVTTVAAPVAQ